MTTLTNIRNIAKKNNRKARLAYENERDLRNAQMERELDLLIESAIVGAIESETPLTPKEIANRQGLTVQAVVGNLGMKTPSSRAYITHSARGTKILREMGRTAKVNREILIQECAVLGENGEIVDTFERKIKRVTYEFPKI